MSHKIKLGYISLGAVIMLIGMGVGSTLTPPLVAQHNGVFDEITCRRIKVVDKAGNVKIRLVAFEDGSWIYTRTKGGTGIALDTNNRGNTISICDPAGKTAFEVDAYVDRTELGVYDKSSGAGIGFYADSNEAKQTRWDPPKEGNTR